MKNLGLVFIFIGFNLNFCFGWGPEGHSIVALVAKSQLKQSTIDKVQSYLGDMTWENTANWMDKIKSTDHSMDTWHYVNIEKDKTYVETEIPNIINQLELAINTLKNKDNFKKAEVKEAILLIFHLVGDLHQPLHVGYPEDRGGNTKDVYFEEKKINLHKVWDSKIIEFKKISLKQCVDNVASFTKEKKQELKIINVIDWMNESRALINGCYELADDSNIDQKYISKNSKIIINQLSVAGIRLASILEENF